MNVLHMNEILHKHYKADTVDASVLVLIYVHFFLQNGPYAIIRISKIHIHYIILDLLRNIQTGLWSLWIYFL